MWCHCAARALGGTCSVELVHSSLPVAEALGSVSPPGRPPRHIGELDLASRLGRLLGHQLADSLQNLLLYVSISV